MHPARTRAPFAAMGRGVSRNHCECTAKAPRMYRMCTVWDTTRFSCGVTARVRAGYRRQLAGPLRPQRALRRNAPAVAARCPPRWRQGRISQAGFRANAAAAPARVRHRAGYSPGDARQRRADPSCGRPSPLHYRCGAISQHCHRAALPWCCIAIPLHDRRAASEDSFGSTISPYFNLEQYCL